MQEVVEKILFHLDRSQAAYELYKRQKKYYQALRIFKANQQVYKLLTEHAHFWRNRKPVIDYLFHLEDWFEQFNAEVKSQQPSLDQEFVFYRLEFSPSFPVDIYNIIRYTR